MTAQRIWTFVRWPLAIALMLAVVAYAAPRLGDALGGMVDLGFEEGSVFDLDGGDATEEATDDVAEVPTTEAAVELPTGPVEDGTAAPVADFGLSGGTADAVDDPIVPIGDQDGAAILAFEALDGHPDCLATMTLGLQVLEATSTEIGIFLADIADAAAVATGGAVAGDVVTTDTPFAVALVRDPGRLELDVSLAYRDFVAATAAAGGAGGPGGDLFVLSVVPTSTLEAGGGVQFAASEQGEETGPSLTWTGVPDCTGAAAGA